MDAVRRGIDTIENRNVRARALGRSEDPEQVLAEARLRQAEMLREVQRRLTEVAARRRQAEIEETEAEREAGALAVHAALAEQAGEPVYETVERRNAVLERLTALDEERRVLTEREQRLLNLEKELTGRIREFGVLVETIRDSRSAESVYALVDRALSGTEGSAQDEDQYETEF